MDIENCNLEEELENNFLSTIKEVLLYTLNSRKRHILQNVISIFTQKKMTEKIEYVKNFCIGLTANRVENDFYFGASAITFSSDLLVKLDEKKLKRGKLEIMTQRINNFSDTTILPQVFVKGANNEINDLDKILKAIKILYSELQGKYIKTECSVIFADELFKKLAMFFSDETKEKIDNIITENIAKSKIVKN